MKPLPGGGTDGVGGGARGRDVVGVRAVAVRQRGILVSWIWYQLHTYVFVWVLIIDLYIQIKHLYSD